MTNGPFRSWVQQFIKDDSVSSVAPIACKFAKQSTTPGLRFVIYSTFAIVAMYPSLGGAQAPLDQNTVRFVADVICRNEYQDGTEFRCNRWVASPRLSTFGSGSHHPTVVANVIKQLNELLPEGTQIQQVEPNQEDASMKVYFVSLNEFPALAKKYGFPVTNNLGFFGVEWNHRYEIQSAVIMIAHDKLRGKRLHHMTLEEITQSLGLAGDSTRFEDSVFYEDQAKQHYGTATRLSELDKKTLRFLYQHVEPGSLPIEVGVQMGRHWK